jgi:hypothetical protein
MEDSATMRMKRKKMPAHSHPYEMEDSEVSTSVTETIHTPFPDHQSLFNQTIELKRRWRRPMHRLQQIDHKEDHKEMIQ